MCRPLVGTCHRASRTNLTRLLMSQRYAYPPLREGASAPTTVPTTSETR